MRSGPNRHALVALVLLVVLAHLGFLFQVVAPVEVRLSSLPSATPVQLRLITPPAKPQPGQARHAPRPRPRVDLPAGAPLMGQPLNSEASAPAELMVPPEIGSSSARPPPTEVSDGVAAQSAPTSQAEQLAQAPATEQPMGSTGPQAAAGWPLISLGALPSSRLMSYQLTGMDKGLTYHASGELRWQHNDRAYEVSLSVRAFLVGSRQWRSTGRIDATGLAPLRFSDSWRNERAAHFDREQQRVVFSSRSQAAPLERGAQDQVSLYVQLAAAVAGEPERFVPGTRLQVQTATVRDAVPWLLRLEGSETLELQGQAQQALKWVCQPRSQYDARVEFWVTPAQAWMPVRIRITQVSGSYIDLFWRGTEPLPDLPSLPVSTPADKPS